MFPYCCDLKLNWDEECERGQGETPAQGTTTCQALDYWAGNMGCSKECRHDTTKCLALNSVSVGYDSACGLDNRGRAWCWGNNLEGQLGVKDPTSSFNPEAVSTAKNFRTVRVGYRSACGLDLTGKAWCWGNNAHGQLGDKTRTGKHFPVAVSGTVSFELLTVGGSHACGLDKKGEAWCWGRNTAAGGYGCTLWSGL